MLRGNVGISPLIWYVYNVQSPVTMVDDDTLVGTGFSLDGSWSSDGQDPLQPVLASMASTSLH